MKRHLNPTECCILADSSAVLSWMNPFVMLGVSGNFVTFILFFMENSVNKQCRP